MHAPLTLGILAVVTGALVLVRIFWLRIPRPARMLLITCAVAIPVIFGIAIATRWSTSSYRINYGLYWLFIAACEFLLILYTVLRPRWLTSIIAVVLILPVLSASIFLPLTLFFDAPPTVTSRIGGNIVSERVPWGAGSAETSGTDLTVYYQPRWLPLLRRRLLSARYYGGQCDAWAAYAVVQPDRRSVLMVCPASPRLGPDSARSIVLPLNRPLFYEYSSKEVIPSSK